MASSAGDALFAGPIPELYEQYLVPMLFAPYAADLAARVAALPATRVLEVAAGTGAMTRQLAALLPAQVEIVATDLNPPMLEHAARVGTCRAVAWRQADALQLPFEAASFDVVACQFGVMFFPDRPKAFAEARRVLRPGGMLLFNTWGRIEDNAFALAVTDALASVFPEDPLRFIACVPHGYHDRALIAADLAAGGFAASPQFAAVAARSRAGSARIAALAFCQGTPLRNQIEARDGARMGQATDAAERLLAQRFGDGAIEGGMLADVVSVRR